MKEWSFGISECNFTKEEILQQFTDNGIEVPEPLLKEFEDNIRRQKQKRYQRDYDLWFGDNGFYRDKRP